MSSNSPPPAAAEPGSSRLLDVLEALPLLEIQRSFWGDTSASGLDGTGRGNFRLACCRSQELGDLLITAAVHRLRRLPKGAEDEDASRFSSGAEYNAHWQDVVCSSAYFARLPRLKSLTMTAWADQAEVALALQRLTGATQGGLQQRLTRLELHGNYNDVSATVLQAVHLAFPALRELYLDNIAATPGPLLVPLHGAEHLTQLFLCFKSRSCLPTGYSSDPNIDILHSLCGLSHLRQLYLSLERDPDGDPHLLRHITGPCSLWDCSISGDRTSTLDDAAGLLAAATQLTQLELGDVAPLPASAGTLARLAALSGLRSLGLGALFIMDDAAWGAVQQLSQLTHLWVGGFKVKEHTQGHLPLLQRLCLGCRWPSLRPLGGGRRGEGKGFMTPSALLRALLPLLPLACLWDLSGRIICDGNLCLDISHSKGQSNRVLEALTKAIQHLDDAPYKLVGPVVRLTGGGLRCGGALSLSQVAHSLRPLGWQLTGMALYEMVLRESAWVEVQDALPELQQVWLSECQLSCGEVACIVKDIASLEETSLSLCAGLGVEEAECAGLPAACPRPVQMRVKLLLPLPAGVIARCQAAQADVHGGHFITWE